MLVGGKYEKIQSSSENWRPFLLFGAFPSPLFLRFVLADDPEGGCTTESKWLRKLQHEMKTIS
jgi:hypothetical protein